MAMGNAYVFVDFDGSVIVLELRGVLGHLQHALVRRRVALLALEEVSRLGGEKLSISITVTRDMTLVLTWLKRAHVRRVHYLMNQLKKYLDRSGGCTDANRPTFATPTQSPTSLTFLWSLSNPLHLIQITYYELKTFRARKVF